MAFHCAHCRSTDVVCMAADYSCLNCGGQTTSSGEPVGFVLPEVPTEEERLADKPKRPWRPA
jgi:hypothetical protein